MLAKRVIPTILFNGANMYKGVGFKSDRIVGNVFQAMKIYSQRQVDEIILFDIGATPEGRGPAFSDIEKMTADFNIPVTVGGGVRSIDDVRGLLNAGADKVCIGSHVTKRRLIESCAEKFGSQAISVALDARDEDGGFIFKVDSHHIWSTHEKGAKWMKDNGAGEIILQSVNRDGTMQGYDLDLIRKISETVDIPVVASGGCSGYEDMHNAIKAGADAVAAGALFLFTDARPAAAAQYLKKAGVEVRL